MVAGMAGSWEGVVGRADGWLYIAWVTLRGGVVWMR